MWLQRTKEDGGSRWHSAAAAQAKQQQLQSQQGRQQDSGSDSTGRELDASSDSSSSSSSSGGGGGVRTSSGTSNGRSGRGVAVGAVWEPAHSGWNGKGSSVAAGIQSAGHQVAWQRRPAVRLYAAVVSLAANRDKRDAVRATWGSDKR